MPVDKFGRSRSIKNKSNPQSTPITYGYVLTSNGDIDIQNKRICNVQLKPIENHEVTSKYYVDSLHAETIKKIDDLIEAVQRLHRILTNVVDYRYNLIKNPNLKNNE